MSLREVPSQEPPASSLACACSRASPGRAVALQPSFSPARIPSSCGWKLWNPGNWSSPAASLNSRPGWKSTTRERARPQAIPVPSGCDVPPSSSQRMILDSSGRESSAPMPRSCRSDEIPTRRNGSSIGRLPSRRHTDQPCQCLVRVPRSPRFRPPDPLPDYPQLGAVHWLGLVFGEGDGAFQLTPDTEHTTNAVVTIDAAFCGDLVVSASYETIGGRRVFAQPSLIFTRAPASATLDGLEVDPAAATFETGVEVKPQWRAVYSDGRRLERWVLPDAFTMVSSRPEVVSVTPNRTWKATQPGTAVVTLSWRGFSTRASLTVPPPPPTQTFEDWRTTRFTAEELAIPEISAPTSDPDANGFNNILEFTSAGNPLVSTSPHRPAIASSPCNSPWRRHALATGWSRNSFPREARHGVELNRISAVSDSPKAATAPSPCRGSAPRQSVPRAFGTSNALQRWPGPTSPFLPPRSLVAAQTT